jgi:uroporphyrinogen decarboxylase
MLEVLPVTPRERVLMALEYREPDIIPYNIPIDPQPAARLDEHYGGREWRSRVQNHAISCGVDWSGERPAEGEWTDRFGVRWTQANIFHSVDVPLKEPSLAGYEWPDLLPDDELSRDREWAAANGHAFRVANMGLLFFERAWCLRGMENLLADLVENPRFVEELFDKLMELHFPLIDRLATLPVEALGFGDDFGAQRGLLMGTTHWRRVLKPRLRQMYERAHQHGKFVHIHCCGDVSPIIEDLIEIGVDIYNPLQPEPQDIYAMKREYGRHITFEGGIGTQGLLPRGTPEAIRTEVGRLKRELGRDGGFIISPTKPILPDVPTENAVACVEAILED